jgi:hypothetical protein
MFAHYLLLSGQTAKEHYLQTTAFVKLNLQFVRLKIQKKSSLNIQLKGTPYSERCFYSDSMCIKMELSLKGKDRIRKYE